MEIRQSDQHLDEYFPYGVFGDRELALLYEVAEVSAFAELEHQVIEMVLLEGLVYGDNVSGSDLVEEFAFGHHLHHRRST